MSTPEPEEIERVTPWGRHAGDGTPAHPEDRVAQWPVHNRKRMQHAVYTLTDEEVAVVNRWRAQNVWKARPLHLCACYINEYCQHCYPESFRPGGVWFGISTE